MYLYEKLAKQRAIEENLKKEYQKREEFRLRREESKKRYISILTSSSHNYGNVLAFMENYILDLFPKNMFNTIHVNSKLAHKQIRGVSHEFVKKNTPMIVFRPRVADYDEDRFLKGTQLLERMNNVTPYYGEGTLFDFFEDQQNDIMIKYHLNRVVMYIDVSLVFSTMMHQLDYYSYIYNRVPIEHPFFVETCLENFIPQDMLDIVSKCCGIPIYDEHGSTKEFISYMNGKSKDPITYKLQGSTNSREFYRYYQTPVQITFQDLQKDDGDRVGSVADRYGISFTARVEFNTSGFYYLFNKNIYDIQLPQHIPDDGTLVPIFTDVFKREDLQLKHGWDLYNRGTCRLDDVNDTIDFDQMLNESIRAVMDYHDKNGLIYDNFIDIRVRKQGKPLASGVGYKIDWKTRKITFINQDTYSTYTVFLCINIEYINDLVKTIYNLK